MRQFFQCGSASNVALVCSSNLLNLTDPTLLGAVCAGMGTYADITANTSGWSYAGYTIGANTCTQDLTASDGISPSAPNTAPLGNKVHRKRM